MFLDLRITNMAFIYQSNNHSRRYSAFKIQYGWFRYFRHFSWMIIIFFGNFWIFVVKRILHVQIRQFGGSNLQKYEILTPITPKKHEKPQNFRYRNFKAKFVPVLTPTSIFFQFPKEFLSSFVWAMCRPSKPMPIFVTALLT